jgi:hypothetical protein
LLLASNAIALTDQLLKEYKEIRENLKNISFAETDNYYFLKGIANYINYEDEEEVKFIAEADAYEKLEVMAYNFICWPHYISTKNRVKIFYEYLKIKPLVNQNEGFTIIKSNKNKKKDFEIIFSINKENNIITFPSTTNMGFLDAC